MRIQQGARRLQLKKELPWVGKEACCLPSKESGLSLLNWFTLTKPLELKVKSQYRDGDRGVWKSVLDQWIFIFLEQRGASLFTVATKCILAPLGTRGSAPLEIFKTSPVGDKRVSRRQNTAATLTQMERELKPSGTAITIMLKSLMLGIGGSTCIPTELMI